MCKKDNHQQSDSDAAVADVGSWSFEAALLKQGAYLLRDANRAEVAVIIAADDSRPIDDHAGENARLLVREHGSGDWHDAGRYVLAEAMARGSAHALRRDRSLDTKPPGRVRGPEPVL